jgi:hypothetical protein
LIVSQDRFEITNTGVQSVDRLEAYLEAERFRGYDPYDALSSPLFRLPVLRSSKWLRIGSAVRTPSRRSPTIVATWIVTNSLFTAYRLLRLDHALGMRR